MGLGLTAGVLALAGCGGGGGGGDAGESGAGGEGGTPAPGPVSNLPPRTGTFGGGQGKVLFVAGGDYPQSLIEFDLASRQAKTLFRLPRDGFHLVGGVTRANDGRLRVTDYKLGLDTRSTAYLLNPGGAVIREFPLVDSIELGAALAPDGKTLAYTRFGYDSSGDWVDAIDVIVVDVASGSATQIRLVNPDFAAYGRDVEDAVGVHPVWAADGTLYTLSNIGLSRVDLAARTTMPVHVMGQGSVANAAFKPDGSEVWYQTKAGDSSSARIWSMNLATGALRRRSERSAGGDQMAPSFSPDGQWMLFQDIVLTYLDFDVSSAHYVAAIRMTEPQIDTHNEETEIRGINSDRYTGSGRMLWF